VTRIGCGYAGYTDAEIAPLFADAPENVELPTGWREIGDVAKVWNPDVKAAAAAPDRRAHLLELELREIRYRLMAVGAHLCEPVSDKNLRDAKKLLEPVYQDAMQAMKDERMSEPSARMQELEADAERWRKIEPLLIDWRDAEHYPTDGTGWSPAQRQAFRTLTGAVDAALLTLKREKETAR
jgi:hypothetical protein